MPVEVNGVINVERKPRIYLDRKTFEQIIRTHRGNTL